MNDPNESIYYSENYIDSFNDNFCFPFFNVFSIEEENKMELNYNLYSDVSSSNKFDYNKVLTIDEEIKTFNIKTCNNIITAPTTNENISSYISLEEIQNNYLSFKFKDNNFRQIIVPGKNTKKYHNYLNNIKENNVKAIMFQTSKKKVKKERKFDLDEIVLKIKSNIIKNIIIFINTLIIDKNQLIKEKNKNDEKQNEEDADEIALLSPLKYDLISRPMNSIFNLSLLDQKIYNILSNEISDNTKKSNYEIIKKIINSKNKENQIIKEALMLTWRDYLDIFRYNYTNALKSKIGNTLFEKIKENFNKIDTFISEMSEKKYNNENKKYDYLTSRLLLAYNYERYFNKKHTRKPCKKREIKKVK
jgi:hypothetical protein